MYTEEERAIFKYDPTGTGKDVHADPLSLDRALTGLLLGDVKGALDAAYAEAGVVDGSMQRLIDAVRKAFGLTPLDPETGAGTTDAMVLGLLHRFSVFMNTLKKTLVS
jgi:hypothetical protein